MLLYGGYSVNILTIYLIFCQNSILNSEASLFFFYFICPDTQIIVKDTKNSRTWWCLRAPQRPIKATRKRKTPTPMTAATTLMLETMPSHLPQAAAPISSRLTIWAATHTHTHRRSVGRVPAGLETSSWPPRAIKPEQPSLPPRKSRKSTQVTL